MAKLSSHPIMVNPGTEGLYVQGMVKSVLHQDLIDEETTNASSRCPRGFKTGYRIFFV